MIPNLKLIHILVHDAGFFYFYKEFLTKRDFQNYLREVPFSLIVTLWIMYRLSGNQVLQLELKKVKPTKGDGYWQVYSMNKPFFSFTCKKRMSFMKVFEEHLRQELEKHQFIRSKPPKGK